GPALRGLRGRPRGLLADELDPLLLGVAALREVAGEGGEEPVRRERGGRAREPPVAAGVGREAVLEVGDGGARAQGGQLLPRGLTVVGMDELQERTSGQLVVAEAQGPLPARVELLERPREV